MRVLYFNGKDLKCFHWSDQGLVGSFFFEKNEISLPIFETYLTQTNTIPTRILVDIMEEDYKLESIPHLLGNNQKLLIKNILKKFFRENIFTYYAYQNKDPKTHKNNIYLLSCLENMGALNTWLTLFEKHNIPVLGIYSLPILSIDLMRKIAPSKDPTLLLSINAPLLLRQTFFDHNQFKFSRLVKLRKEHGEAQDATTLTGIFISELQNLSRFFSSQKLFSHDKTLQVYILCKDQIIDEMKRNFPDILQMEIKIKVHFCSIESLLKKYEKSKATWKYADGLFSRLCESTKKSSHYSTAFIKNNIQLFLIKKISLFSATAFITIALLTLQTTLILTYNINQNVKKINAYTDQFEKKYSDDFYKIKRNLIASSVMEKAYHKTEEILIKSDLHPVHFMNDFSSILSKPEFKKITIARINWMRAENEKDPKNPNENTQKIAPTSTTESTSINNSVTSPVIAAQIAEVEGFINIDDLPYGEVVSNIESFILGLKTLNKVISVKVITWPIDLRSKMAYQDSSGYTVDNLENKKHFLIKIKMEKNSP